MDVSAAELERVRAESQQALNAHERECAKRYEEFCVRFAQIESKLAAILWLIVSGMGAVLLKTVLGGAGRRRMRPVLTLTRERPQGGPREQSDDQGTFGRLEGNGLQLECVEPPWRDNARNRSCIPPGQYLVRPHVSPRFGPCLHVEDVPNRTHVLIHAGNVGGDPELGYRTHTRGCLLPDTRKGRLWIRPGEPRIARPPVAWQRAVLASRPALRQLLEWVGGRTITLQITME